MRALLCLLLLLALVLAPAAAHADDAYRSELAIVDGPAIGLAVVGVLLVDRADARGSRSISRSGRRCSWPAASGWCSRCRLSTCCTIIQVAPPGAPRSG